MSRAAPLAILLISILTLTVALDPHKYAGGQESPVTDTNPIGDSQPSNPGLTAGVNGTATGESDSIVGFQLSSPEVILLALAVIIVAGVVGEAFFRKTGIPDIAFLMVLGVLFGPILNVISTEVVIQIVPYFAALALIMIMFDGGLGLKIGDMLSIAHFAFPLAIIIFAVSTLIVSAVSVIGLGWELLAGTLLGVMVGGSSSIVVFGLVRRLTLSEETKALLSLESALTDILATISAFVLFGIIVTSQVNISEILGISFTSIAVGIGLGIGVGVPWIYVASKLSKTPHAHMFTLAVLFLLFFLAKSLGESGALTALVFGLILGNRRIISKRLNLDIDHVATDNTFHNEITFLVRTFFFVFIGLLANLATLEYIIFGVVMALVLYFARIQITKYTFQISGALARLKLLRIPATAWKETGGIISPFDKRVVEVMMPRGLAAAVLATIPLSLGLPNAEVYPQVVFVVIISSVIITTVGLSRAGRGQVVIRIPRNKDGPSEDAEKLDEPASSAK